MELIWPTREWMQESAQRLAQRCRIEGRRSRNPTYVELDDVVSDELHELNPHALLDDFDIMADALINRLDDMVFEINSPGVIDAIVEGCPSVE